MGYDHLSESTREIRRIRAQRREEQLTRAEREARDLALEEARDARYRPVPFAGGPWAGRTEMVELLADGRLPPELMVVGREPTVTDFGALMHVPGQYRYVLRRDREDALLYISAEELWPDAGHDGA